MDKKKLSEAKARINKMTKEQLKAAKEKKEACNAKAQSVVERLIEPCVDQLWLLENLFHINQSHFQDAVEERAITKYCGYPLCDSSLDNVPSKKYCISTKQNKVFDLTDRKSYCSNLCYKAGVYLKEQLFTSPLWLRDCEKAVGFKLYAANSPCGSSGVEIDLGNIPPIKPDDALSDVEKKTEESSLSDAYEAMKISDDGPSKLSESTGGFSAENIDAASSRQPEPGKDSSASTKLEKLSKPNSKSAVSDHIVEKTFSNAPLDKRKSTHKRTDDTKRLKSLVSMGQKVEDYLLGWHTIDTLAFLLGEDKMKEMLRELGTSDYHIEKRKSKDNLMYERYEEICRRLNVIELKDSQPALATRPLPDYEELKRKAKEMDLKVRSFYMGDSKVAFVETDEKNSKVDEEENILPLVDHHAIRATRRRLVLDKLDKTLPDVQSALNLHGINIMTEIHELVVTLAFSSTNIVLKPAEWNLVAIVLISFLTLRNQYLKEIYQSSITQKRLVSLLMTYNLDLNYLARQILNLNNIEQIIQNSA